MAKINIMSSMFVIVLFGCAASPPSDRDSQELSTVQQAFPAATGLREVSIPQDAQPFEHADKMTVKVIHNQSVSLGYCVGATVAAKSGPFRICILADSNLLVRRASVVSYTWDRGRDVRKSKFTRQFEGRGPDDPIQIGQDIDAITGATLSSKAMAQGVRDAVTLLRTMQ
ncbi:MAG: FMN-binding protein [Phycisphaeraceae bacterium]|nr:FMN-binding protein [Phycisphaeraceae bacterium]